MWQSERFFSALKGHGALTRLVLLPLESHGYQGRESVMHCLWEMDRWLQKYCVNATGNDGNSSETNLQAGGSEPKTSGAQGGGPPESFQNLKAFLYGFGPLSSL